MHPKLEGSKLLHADADMRQFDDACLEQTESAWGKVVLLI